MTEKQVEAGIIRDLKLLGWHVSKISQFGKPKGMSIGIPDLYAMHPKHGGVWIEVKTKRGTLSQGQMDWHTEARYCGVPCCTARSTQDVLTYVAQRFHAST